ncbi:MAG: hypothetical protein JNM20_19305 [Rhizobiales bacterium]|nr:hypothetical protein [Hyphomicrobiales bacterium]
MKLSPRLLALLAAAALAGVVAPSCEAKALKWSCTYPATANPGGVFKREPQELIFGIDETGEHATVTRAQGTHAVEVFAGTDGLTFIDRLKSGAVEVTTIDSAGKSVHSRHAILGGLLIPSQSYGTCAAVEDGTAVLVPQPALARLGL